jgi:hypothetical protein
VEPPSLPLRSFTGATRRTIPAIAFEITELNYHETDWRKLADLEIRADPAWHDKYETTNEYGQFNDAEALLDVFKPVSNPAEEEGDPPHPRRGYFIAHDFIIRFGTRDGLCFPCEIDAWMIPRDEYYRTEPESAADLARFAEGPPNFRAITQARFTHGSVNVPRCSEDPERVARRYLREATGYEGELCEPRIEWALRHTADRKEIVPMPGFASRVHFRTP